MLLLRRPKHNVAISWLRRYVGVRNISTAQRQQPLRKDFSNAFISYNANAPYKSPEHHHLVNAGIETRIISEDRNIAVAVKDNICTLDYPTTCASRALDGFQSPYDATVVTLLKKSGVRIVGKTNMDEFGMGSHSTNSHFGAVVQRYEGDDGEVIYSAGGSSGGSAVAVQQDMCDAAIGTDTGGSVRLPAAWCGVVGFKPSYGSISRWGVVDYANSLDTVGIFAKTVEKIEPIFTALRHYDRQDPTAWFEPNSPQFDPTVDSKAPDHKENNVGSKKFTIGVPAEYNIAELSPWVRNAWHHALEACQRAGHDVVPISLPATKSALSAYYVLAPAEASSNLAKYDGVRYGTRAEGADGANGPLFSNTRAEGFGDEVKRRILLGSYSLSADAIDNYFLQAQRVRRLVQKDFDNVFAQTRYSLESSPELLNNADERGTGTNIASTQQKVDFILCPTAPTPPPRLTELDKQTPVEAYINDVFTVPASLAGLPAISIPCSSSDNTKQTSDPSSNVGLQIIGQFRTDWQLLEFAKELEIIL